MICKLCAGRGWLICFDPMEWWRCPKCKGAGTTGVFGPAEFVIGKAGKKTLDQRK